MAAMTTHGRPAPAVDEGVRQALSEPGYLREKQVLRIFPVSRSSWWLGIKEGRYPKPVRLAGCERTVAWRKKDILALIEKTENQQ